MKTLWPLALCLTGLSACSALPTDGGSTGNTTAQPILVGDTLRILTKPPQAEPKHSFITLNQMEQHYAALLGTLQQYNPEANAQQAIRQGQRYRLLSGTATQQQAQFPEDPLLSDRAVRDAVEKACPPASDKTVEAELEWECLPTPQC